MDELALRSRACRVIGEYSNAVPDARASELNHGEPNVDFLGKGERREIGAARLNHERDRIASFNIEHPFIDHPCVHRAVEPLVKYGVVDVTVGIIVCPPGGKAPPDLELGSSGWRLPRHQAAS
jgi:hypothetical protein